MAHTHNTFSLFNRADFSRRCMHIRESILTTCLYGPCRSCTIVCVCVRVREISPVAAIKEHNVQHTELPILSLLPPPSLTADMLRLSYFILCPRQRKCMFLTYIPQTHDRLSTCNTLCKAILSSNCTTF